MYFLIIILPLIGTFFSGLLGHQIGVYGATRITVSCMTLTFLLSCIAFYEVALAGSPCYFELYKWFDSELITFSWGFLFDSLTVVMLVVVTSISMCVHLYSTEYMSNDPHIQRFMAYLSLFTFFMIILVTADNFFQMFLGWEGVGLCSYLLVNFWFGRLQANKAAIKAMVVNRIGDIGLALGIFLIYFVFKSIDYSTVFALTPSFQNFSINFFNFELNVISIICFFFFIAATGKSAQIGLHTWLPDAMEGPTPVSALIHAATMVTAGVFLIVRCSPLFEFAPTISVIITISGAMTAFMAATIGLVQNDLKRVIAYSTCSQLGYMMIACGTSGYAVGMFHLTNHAFFKALLFLSAGSIIHAVADEQDMRKMGGLLNLLPFTYSMLLIGSLSLMGFPFLTGFYSKDLILEWTFSQFTINGLFAYWLGSLSAFFTAFYSFRVICLTFLRKPSYSQQTLSNIHESPLNMAFPLFFLSIFSIFIGYILRDMFVGIGTDFWGNSIFILPKNLLLVEAEFLNTSIKIFPVCLSLLGGMFSFLFYNFYFKILFNFKISMFGRNIYIFFNRKWFFDKIYNYIFAHNILTWGYKQAYQNIDRGILEFLGPTGLWNFIQTKSIFLNSFYNQNLLTIGRIRILFRFIYLMLLATLFLSFYFLYSTKNLNFFSFLFTKNAISETAFFDFINEISQENSNLTTFFENYLTFYTSLSNFQQYIWDYKITSIILNSPEVLEKDFFGLASFGFIFDISLYPKLANNNINPLFLSEITCIKFSTNEIIALLDKCVFDDDGLYIQLLNDITGDMFMPGDIFMPADLFGPQYTQILEQKNLIQSLQGRSNKNDYRLVETFVNFLDPLSFEFFIEYLPGSRVPEKSVSFKAENFSDIFNNLEKTFAKDNFLIWTETAVKRSKELDSLLSGESAEIKEKFTSCRSIGGGVNDTSNINGDNNSDSVTAGDKKNK